MSLEPTLLLFALVVFASYAVQTVVGFGSMLICVTLGAQLLDIREVVTLAVPISILQTGYIVVRHHGGIDRGLLFKRILPLMSVGTLIGFLAFANAAVGWLRSVTGVGSTSSGARRRCCSTSSASTRTPRSSWGVRTGRPSPCGRSARTGRGPGWIN